MKREKSNKKDDFRFQAYGCLPCYHSRMNPMRCVHGFDVKKGRACGKFEAANGRQV